MMRLHLHDCIFGSFSALMARMPHNLPFFIAIRYVFSRQEQRFISFVSLVSWLGLILGVAAMIVVLSVMNGFDREMRQRILRVIPHGFVTWQAEKVTQDWSRVAERLQNEPGIEAVAPLIRGKALVVSGRETVAVELSGILPSEESKVSELKNSLLAGELADLTPDGYDIILGQQLARRLGVTIGDEVRVVLPDVNVTVAGVFSRQKIFIVRGIFRVGAEPDGQLALVHLQAAAKLFRKWQINKQPLVTQLRVKTMDIHRANLILAEIDKKLAIENLHVTSWEDDHRTLFNAIRMERKVISLLLFAVITVAVFNIASILIMMVSEKRHDIAILRVMGASARQIVGVFVLQGLLIGVLGILVGVIIGSILAVSLESIISGIEFLVGGSAFDADVYYIAHLPSDYRISDVVLISVVSFALCIIAAIYPAWQSSKIDPVFALNE